MAVVQPSGAVSPDGGQMSAHHYRPALTLLATLFFMWGFITVINNTLLPHLRSVFDLNYTQTTLIESGLDISARWWLGWSSWPWVLLE